MFVGMMTLHNGWDLIRKKKVLVREWAAYALALLGLAALLLAPGNFVRVDTQGSMLPPFIDNAWTLFYQNTTSVVSIPYLLMLSLTAAFGEKKNSRRMLALNVVILAGCLISTILDKAIFDVALIGLLTVQIVMLLIRERFAPGVWFLILVGLGSQGMLLISAIWGFRCMFSMYMVYMLLIGCALYRAEARQRQQVLAAGLLMSFHPALALVFCLLLTVRKTSRHTLVQRALPGVVCCMSMFALVGLILGYAQNVPTHRQNLRATAQMHNGTVNIEELPDDRYSWYFVPIGEFHEDYYRILHEIPDSVEIVYEELPE